MRGWRALLCLAAVLAVLVPARAAAEELIAALSENHVAITPDFTGREIVLFGTIAGTDAFATAEGRDIVVVVCGPPAQVTVRRKEPVAGIWVNGASATFENVPGFHFVASTRPLAEIAPETAFACFRRGTDVPAWQESSGLGAEQARTFARALEEEKAAQDLFQRISGDTAVVITDFALFETRIPIPGVAPVGAYEVRVCLFRDRQEVHCVAQLPLYVEKTGMERLLFEVAHDWPWAYGLAIVILSLLAGWASTLVTARN